MDLDDEDARFTAMVVRLKLKGYTVRRAQPYAGEFLWIAPGGRRSFGTWPTEKDAWTWCAAYDRRTVE